MSDDIPLPPNVRKLVQHHEKPGEMHPGLFLDKFVPSYAVAGGNRSGQKDAKCQEKVQLPAVKKVVKLSEQEPKGLDFEAVRERWTQMLDALKSRRFKAETTGPLTLHLARASALENAGICLHPLYGFTYLPGTGLKGMAHAYATQVWLAGQPDKDEAWNQIRVVFGSGASPLLKKIATDLDVSAPADSHAGSVVFHDAWPVTWPRLTTDIVNCHHPKYYQPQGSQANPPGDWENPVPVYFLSVPAGQQFECALAPRHEEVSDECIQLARQWLLGALSHRGAGAKTNAGYGGFKPVEGARPAIHSDVYQDFETTVELVTPAFLAGADQDAHDCELRPATLRGLLRWWWRTMHAGFLSVDDLRLVETAIWGDSQTGGAVRVEVVALESQPPTQFNKRVYATMSPDEKDSEYGIKGRSPKKTTQGLWYLSYGMDEKKSEPRHFVEPGAKWTIRFIARNVSAELKAEQVLLQACAAFWLLCQYGGVGAKGRKGFGSLQAKGDIGLDEKKCLAAAAQLRQIMSCSLSFEESRVQSPALQQRIEMKPVEFKWPRIWDVLDQVGFACQSFAAQYKHHREKKALGLPRKIGHPQTGDFRPTGPVGQLQEEAKRQKKGGDIRHASPAHFHVARNADGNYVVRTIAFPAAFLPDLSTSKSFLREYLGHVEHELMRRAQLDPPRPSKKPQAGPDPHQRGERGRGRQAPRREDSAQVPEISAETLKEKLSKLNEGEAIYQLDLSRGSKGDEYSARRLRPAPKIPQGYQPEGGFAVHGAPPSLPNQVFVLVTEEAGKRGGFREVVGRFPQRDDDRRNKRGRNRR